ncbi:MAG: arginine N-succinyltransferase [Acidimicrobiia bacterium]|nr:arginine N-succinyltransferase [Acidimicrobiia bacterium]
MSSLVLLRHVRSSDIESLWDLLDAGVQDIVGMTTLPSSLERTEELVEHSSQTVTALATGEFELASGRQAHLLMVAVDPISGQVLGISGMTFKQDVPNLAVQVTTSLDGLGLTMRSSSDPWTRTELNSIYVGPAGRSRRLGTLLSRGRFLFLHLVRSQTPATVAAHLRGRFDPDGSAPFWRCFGARFAPWNNSVEAEAALAADPKLIEELADLVLPLTPLDLDSLGRVNSASLPAFRMLMTEGLRSNGMYDPIDGGPTVAATIGETWSGRHRVHGHSVPDSGGMTDALVAVPSVARFGAFRIGVEIAEDSGIHLHRDAAGALGLEPGALVTALRLRGEEIPR